MIQRLLALSIGVALLHCCSTIHAQHIPLCESLNDADAQQNDPEYSEVKIRRVRAICDAIYSSQSKAEERDLNTIPEFDLTQIQSDQDAEHILRRFRRRGGRGGGSSGGRSGGGSRSGSSGGRFSFGSRSSSSSGSRSSFFGSRSSSSSSSSSSSGSRIFSRGSSSSSSGSGSSRIFSRGASSSSSSGTGSSGSRIFSRSSGSSSSSGGAGSSRIFSRSSGSSGTPAQRSSIRIFSRNPSSSNTGSRIREAVRTMIHKPSSSAGSGTLPGAGGTRVISGPKPSLSDKIRKITHSGGGGGSGMFGGGSSGISGGSGSSAWVRAGKKFLPHAVRFGKRYYQRRKYTTGMYAGMGGGAGYYAGSRMNHHGHVYQNSYYGYPPVVDQVPDQIEGQAPTVFYCIQEDLNATLVNETLSAEGVGTCNISGKLVTCPIEIECKLSEADNCCEDELGTPYCCGGPIPVEYATEYGGYGDDAEDAAETLHQMLNVFTATCALLATICLTMWQRRGE